MRLGWVRGFLPQLIAGFCGEPGAGSSVLMQAIAGSKAKSQELSVTCYLGGRNVFHAVKGSTSRKLESVSGNWAQWFPNGTWHLNRETEHVLWYFYVLMFGRFLLMDSQSQYRKGSFFWWLSLICFLLYSSLSVSSCSFSPCFTEKMSNVEHFFWHILSMPLSLEKQLFMPLAHF